MFLKHDDEHISNALGDLQLKSNQLNRVPGQIKFFKRLDTINLSFNNIKTIESGDFNFTAPLKQLSLISNSISMIQSGAFNGIKILSSIIYHFLFDIMKKRQLWT